MADLKQAELKMAAARSDSLDRLAFSSSTLSALSLGAHTPSLHDSSSTADRVDNDDVPQPSFSTDAAANPATAASTSSSPEVAECCEVCLLVRRVSALWTVAFLFDVC